MLERDEQFRQTVRGLAGLDPLLQHRSRLGACVLLSTADALTFSRLKALLNETDGNLGAQLRKLEEAGYVGVKKVFEQRKPVSWYALTPAGRKALRAHLAAMDDIVRRGLGSGG
jgi:DNA-binding MarR family transcriptional regulator